MAPSRGGAPGESVAARIRAGRCRRLQPGGRPPCAEGAKAGWPHHGGGSRGRIAPAHQPNLTPASGFLPGRAHARRGRASGARRAPRAFNPKLRPVQQAVCGLTWGSGGLAGWRSGYFKVSGIGAPMRSKASRWVLVGSVSTGTVTAVLVNRTWLRARVARCSTSPRKLRQGRAGGIALPGGFGLGGGGAAGGSDRVLRGRRVLVGEGQRRPRFTEVPGQVAGQHADQHVRPDAAFEPAEHRPQVQVVGFDRAEIPLDVLEALVGGDHGGAVQLRLAGSGVRST